MYVVLNVIALAVLLFALQEGCRRASGWVLWGAFLAVPVVLTPYWVAVNEHGPFPWIKLYTVVFSVCWCTALRRTPLGKRPWARAAVTGLLGLNILEAVALDLLDGGPAHVLNAAAGFLLIATLARRPGAVRVETAGGVTDMRYAGITRGWVCGFSAWNWAFVYLNYPALAGHQSSVLLAGLAVAAFDPGRWLQARAYSLGLNLIALATCFGPLLAWMDTSDWGDDRLGGIVAVVALAVVAGCTACAAWGRPRDRPTPADPGAGWPDRATAGPPPGVESPPCRPSPAFPDSTPHESLDPGRRRI